jgi:hypothetical protein
MTNTHDGKWSGRAIMGGLFIIVGAILLLEKLDVIYLEEFLGIQSIWSAWPVIFVIIGLGKIIDSPTMKRIGEGSWLIFLGAWLFVSINHVYGLSFRETWPAMVIAFGASILWESFVKNTKVKAGGAHYGKQ